MPGLALPRRADSSLPRVNYSRQPWEQFGRLPEAELALRDPVVINCACAVGLPGMESMDVAECVRRVDQWTERVEWETRKNLWRYERRPEKYNHSRAHFRVLALITALQRKCGLRYDPAKIDEDVPFETADSFVPKALFGEGGTCASMPVIYVAVGRRLGYPLRLVNANGGRHTHLFARWDHPAERFNVEATAEGLRCPPDDYYRVGRYKTDPQREQQGCFLRSLTPRQELAGYLMERGHCCRELKQFRRAAASFAWASGLAPENVLFRNTLSRTLDEWYADLQGRHNGRTPRLEIEADVDRFPPALPLKLQRDIFALEALQNLANNGALEDFKAKRGREADWAAVRFTQDGMCTIGLRAKDEHHFLS